MSIEQEMPVCSTLHLHGFFLSFTLSVLRALAEGRVGWAFWPPGTPVDQISNEGHGVWIPGGDDVCDLDDEGIDPESEEERHVSFDTEDEITEVEDDDDEDATEDVAITGLGRFGALALSDEEDEE